MNLMTKRGFRNLKSNFKIQSKNRIKLAVPCGTFRAGFFYIKRGKLNMNKIQGKSLCKSELFAIYFVTKSLYTIIKNKTRRF